MTNDSKDLANGQERHCWHFSSIVKRMLVQYDYRHHDGVLFSTIKRTLEDCWEARDEWLEKREKTGF